MTKTYKIAIDGPVASGKGTLASGLAKRLHILCINTGAMYRALALACIAEHVDVHNEQDVIRVLQRYSIYQYPDNDSNNGSQTLLNNKDVTDAIYTEQIDKITPIIAAMVSVRKEMVIIQRRIAEGRSVVMEGRDIGTKVLPDADIKIYLSASLHERAKRRQEQLKEKGLDRSIEQVMQDVQTRDKIDSERDISPLKKAEDAVDLNTTNLSIETTIERVIDLLRERLLV